MTEGSNGCCCSGEPFLRLLVMVFIILNRYLDSEYLKGGSGAMSFFWDPAPLAILCLSHQLVPDSGTVSQD